MSTADGPLRRALAVAVHGDLVRLEESPVRAGFALLPQEERRMAGAVRKRRAEFATGRHLASLACAAWGLPRPVLDPDPNGAPTWPAGHVGSITHCDTWAGVAVARRADVASVGIDVEPAAPLPSEVVSTILTPRERRAAVGAWTDEAFARCFDRLVFCVKEAVFKAWYPLTGAWLDFRDAEIELATDGRWHARGSGVGADVQWSGGWAVHGGFAAAVVVLPVDGELVGPSG